MDIINQISKAASEVLQENYQFKAEAKDLLVNETKPEFEGDYTVVLFSFVKALKKSPDTLGNELGQALLQKYPGLFSRFNVIKGFLNLSISDSRWNDFLQEEYANKEYGRKKKNGKKVMVEYSSPNTNKPLHMGHLRNNFLGWSVAEIYKANGYEVVKTCIANDRGIHICKSMISWQLFAGGATPASTGIKGDHFVGDYYVKFNEELKKQAAPVAAAIYAGDYSRIDDKTVNILQKHLARIKELEDLLPAAKDDKHRSGLEGKIKEEQAAIKDIAENATTLMRDTKQMLVDWEKGKPEVVDLWKTMNSWVYAGFDETYKRIGSDFDKIYYESDTYLLGKDLVESGLKKGVFFQKEDGSVWIDLTADGLDQKIVQRKDGTAVYMTQDIGLAVNKYEEFHCDLSVYVVGDEQNYHFKVLKLICQKLGLPSADGIYHLSYGMVELPTGRMKTREGTVVDADDLLDEMILESENKTKEQGKTEGFSAEELKVLYETIGTGGLKFFLLRVDPKKRMVFNPSESIELHGYTATFIQYTYTRTQAIFRKLEAGTSATFAEQTDDRDLLTTQKIDPGTRKDGGEIVMPVKAQGKAGSPGMLLPLERALIITLEKYPSIVEQAGMEMSPSVITGYAFEVAQTFNSFYNAHFIINAETPEKKELRTRLSQMTANILQSSMALLGIRLPERM